MRMNKDNFFFFYFRSWTYEVFFRYEIVRLISIVVFFFGYGFLNEYVLPKQFNILVLLDFLYSSLLLAMSISRLIQIKSNKKHAKEITADQLLSIIDYYVGDTCYLLIENKYVFVSENNKDYHFQTAKLIRIGKKELYLCKEAMRIIDEE